MQRSVNRLKQFLFVVALAAWPRLSPAAPLRADTAASQLVIRAGRGGFLATLAHNHEFIPARWKAEVDFDAKRPQQIRVDVTIDAATLHDHIARLSQKSRDYVDRETAGPEVLDAQRYPEITFHAQSAEARVEGGDLQGVLHGTLSLHGTTRPLDVPFHARVDAPDYHVSGSVTFRQTDFGMTPFSTAAGSIGVNDEIQVDFELVLVPASEAPVTSTRPKSREEVMPGG